MTLSSNKVEIWDDHILSHMHCSLICLMTSGEHGFVTKKPFFFYLKH